jgi:hypothetical protein
MFDADRRWLPGRLALVVVMVGLVHAVASDFEAAAARDQKGKRSEVSAAAPKPADSLPPGVVEMRDQILAAVAASDIEELRLALEWNELPPEIDAPPGSDPIAYWRSVSADGQGRDILAILGDLLATPPAAVPGGRDIENNRLYVWPAFAEKSLATLTADERALLARLVPADAAKAMMETSRYSGWRLVIGADGTWHTFKRGN